MPRSDDAAVAMQRDLAAVFRSWCIRHHVSYQEGLAAVCVELARYVEHATGNPDDVFYSFTQAHNAAFPSKAIAPTMAVSLEGAALAEGDGT